MPNSTAAPFFENSSLHSQIDEPVNNASYYLTTLISTIIVGVLAPVATIGNTLILTAIVKTPSLRTPSHILLFGLAFTDLCTGLITEPFYVVYKLAELQVDEKRSTFCLGDFIVNVFGTYFEGITLLTIALHVMSVERWLHTSRRSLVTARRVIIIYIVTLLLAVVFTADRVSLVSVSSCESQNADFLTVVLSLICSVVTSAAYLKLFKIIRRHQHQIQSNQPSQSLGHPAIDFSKYKRSVFTILSVHRSSSVFDNLASRDFV